MSLIGKGFGLTTAGLNRPALGEILEDTQDEVEAAIASGVLRREPGAVLGGQICGVMAAGRDEDWQVLQAVHASFDPRTATGISLEGLSALSDTARHPPLPSVVGSEIVTGDNGTQLFPGDVVSSPDDQLRYVLAGSDPSTPACTLATATARATSQVIAIGDVRSNSGRCYAAVQAGTTGGGAGPSGNAKLPTTETDGTVRWLFAGDGLAFARVLVLSETAGPIGGSAGILTKIGSPRAGWRGCVNDQDVAVGRSADNDEQLRIRRVAGLSGRGKSTLDAVRGGLIGRTDVNGAIVFENTEHDTNADGMPGHSLEPVITGPAGTPTEDAWAGELLSDVAAGIKTTGNTTRSVSDGYGIPHTIKLTRPAEVDVYVKVTVRANQKLWPSDAAGAGGKALAKAAVLGYGQAFAAGLDARHSAIEGAVWAAGIPGMLAVSAQLALVPITTEIPGDIPINLRQIAKLDTSRTDVVVTFEDP